MAAVSWAVSPSPTHIHPPLLRAPPFPAVSSGPLVLLLTLLPGSSPLHSVPPLPRVLRFPPPGDAPLRSGLYAVLSSQPR